MYFGYSLELLFWGASNEYPQYMFDKNKKKYMPGPENCLICHLSLTFTTHANSADAKLMSFFRSLGDKLHEMSKPIF